MGTCVDVFMDIWAVDCSRADRVCGAEVEVLGPKANFAWLSSEGARCTWETALQLGFFLDRYHP